MHNLKRNACTIQPERMHNDLRSACTFLAAYAISIGIITTLEIYSNIAVAFSVLTICVRRFVITTINNDATIEIRKEIAVIL